MINGFVGSWNVNMASDAGQVVQLRERYYWSWSQGLRVEVVEAVLTVY